MRLKTTGLEISHLLMSPIPRAFCSWPHLLLHFQELQTPNSLLVKPLHPSTLLPWTCPQVHSCPQRTLSLMAGRWMNELTNEWMNEWSGTSHDLITYCILGCFWLTGCTDYSVSRRWHSWVQLYKSIHLPIFGLHAVSPVGQVEPVPGAPPIQWHGGVWVSQPSSPSANSIQKWTRPGAKSQDMWNETERRP